MLKYILVIFTEAIGPGKFSKVIFDGDYYWMSFKLDYKNISLNAGNISIYYKFYQNFTLYGCWNDLYIFGKFKKRILC